jgi:hypothetical protein
MSQQYPPGGGGWGPPPGGAPDPQQQSAQAAWGQAPGGPQPMPAAPGYPPGYQASAGPQQPGFMHAMSAPPGATKVMWVGVLLMVISFAFKQILVDISVQSAGKLLDRQRLRANQRAEIATIDSALDEVKNEIAELEDTPNDPPKSESDFLAWEAKKKERDEKMEKLKTKRNDLEKTLQPKRKKVRDEYRPKIAEAERAETQAQASSMGKIQWTITLKLFVDMMKLIGASMVVLSALRINVDPDQSGGTKAYAAVLGGVAFISMVIGGIYAALFG